MENHHRPLTAEEEVQRLLEADSTAQPQGEPGEYPTVHDPLHHRPDAQQAREQIERGRKITDEIAEHLHSSVEQEREPSHDRGEQLQAHAQAARHNVQGKARQVQDKAQQVREQAEQSSARAQERIQSAGHEAHTRADTAMSQSGANMQTLSSNVRERRPDGPAGEVADRAAGVLDSSGRYLQRSNPTDVRNDLEQLMRKHPLETILVGLGAGYLLNRATSKRR
jgi:hypothetical protein